MKIGKNLQTEESRAFWASVEQAAREAENLPEARRVAAEAALFTAFPNRPPAVEPDDGDSP